MELIPIVEMKFLKSVVINDKENELASRFDALEYKEWVLALKEREIDLREREPKVHGTTVSEKERELKFVKPCK